MKSVGATEKAGPVATSYPLGSRGPGGGIVFYDAGRQKPWGRYLEFAPENWSAWGGYSPNVPFPADVLPNLSPAVGKGLANTRMLLGWTSSDSEDWLPRLQDQASSSIISERMKAAANPDCPPDVLLGLASDKDADIRRLAIANPQAGDDHKAAAALAETGKTKRRSRVQINRVDADDLCPLDAAVLAASYRGGGFNDWYLPSLDEMRLLSKYWRKYATGGFGEDWTIEEWLGCGGYLTSTTDEWGAPELVDVREGDGERLGDLSRGHVRPVRAFGGPRPRRRAGEVREGDKGPGGGIVVHDLGYEAEWGRYLEVAPKGWSGKARDPLALLLEDPDDEGPELPDDEGSGRSNTQILQPHSEAASLACDYRGGGKDDWFLPSRDELKLIYSYWARTGELGLVKGGPYWTSSNPEQSAGCYRIMTRVAEQDGAWWTGWDLLDQFELDEAAAHVRPARWFH